MKDLIKKYKEIEARRNAIAAENGECRGKLRALKADDDGHAAAIKELEKEKLKTLYIDLGQVEKKIQTHKAAQEKLQDSISDVEYQSSVFKRQLNTLDGELIGIKRQLFGAIADDLVKSVSADTKTHLLEIYTAIQMSGLRPAPQDIFDMLFGKGWDHGSQRDIELGVMKKFNLI